MKTNAKVDEYLLDGCGRCPHYKTPECKVQTWIKELSLLRKVVLDSGLKEEFKWSQPCYTYKNQNVLITTAYKDFACISFFKGSLLKDNEKILIAPGKSSQAARQLRYTKVEEIIAHIPIIQSYIKEAVDIERNGLKVHFKSNPEPMPVELQQILENDPELKSAFEGLTKGRQRGYILHFSQPKRSQTRISRIAKWAPTILKGEGMHDAYRRSKK